MSDGYTEEDLGNGLTLRQAKAGYRFSADALALAAFVSLRSDMSVLDLGCGNGVLLLLLAAKRRLRLVGVEKMAAPAALARRNVAANGLAAAVYHGDAMAASSLLQGERFDLIVTNPPYFPVDACRLPHSEEIAAAKTELYWDPAQLMTEVAALLKDDGKFALIQLATRRREMVSLAAAAGLVLCREEPVSFGDEGSRTPDRVLLEFEMRRDARR